MRDETEGSVFFCLFPFPFCLAPERSGDRWPTQRGPRVDMQLTISKEDWFGLASC